MNLKQRIGAWYALRRITKAIEGGAGRPLTREERTMLKNLFYKIFGASWVTTLVGWIATAVGVQSTVGWFTPDGKPNWGVIIFAIAAAVFSRQVKDAGVTGGTRPNTVNF